MTTARLSNSSPCLPLASQDGGAHQDVARRPPVLRREQLRNELLATVNSLQHRRADQISEGFIADYVALNWLEWNGGALRLTVTGTNMCQQMRSVMN